jgi:hypothetical protein
MYRRFNQRPRRYGYQNPAYQNDAANNQIADIEPIKEIENIPLPNELESPSEFSSIFRGGGITSIVDFFKTRIHLEEIIIIGLIIILIGEGIDCLEDEFLLIALVYILIA